jgi:hypothetical protein
MAKDENKWSRERGYWERNGPDFGIIIVSVIFLGLMVGAAGFLLFKPEIPGLADAFKAPPPPPPPGPSRDQKFHYSVPGEAEVLIFPGKPVQLPMPAPEKPAPSR